MSKKGMQFIEILAMLLLGGLAAFLIIWYIGSAPYRISDSAVGIVSGTEQACKEGKSKFPIYDNGNYVMCMSCMPDCFQYDKIPICEADKLKKCTECHWEGKTLFARGECAEGVLTDEQRAAAGALIKMPELQGTDEEKYKQIFTIAAQNFGGGKVDEPLMSAIMSCGEHGSKWPAFAESSSETSSAGATGTFQFIPSTWSSYGVDCNGDGKIERENIYDAACGAAKYLADMAEGGNNCHLNPDKTMQWSVAACYNGGPDAALESKTTRGSGDTTFKYADRVKDCYDELSVS